MRKYLSAIVFLSLFWVHSALANTCVFVGGTHNWSDTTGWTGCGGVSPTSADDVLVGTGTGGSTTGTLTVDGTSGSPSLARGIDFTSFVGTFNSTGTTPVLTIGDPGGSAAGTLKFVSGMTYSMAAAGVINFVSTNTGNTITTAGKTMANMTFNGAGGSWLLQDNFTATGSTTDTLTTGTLDANNHNFTPYNFLSLTGGTRALNMGSGTTTVPSGGSWIVGNLASGLTINGQTSTYNPSFAVISLTMGDQTYHDYLQNATGAFGPTINGTPTFNNFTANSPNVASSILLNGGITVNGLFTATGNSFSQNTRLLIRSSAYGVPATLVLNGTTSTSRLDFKDIHASGSASLDFSAITGNSGDCGGNTGLTLTTPATVYAKMTTSGNIDGLPWKTTSGGAVVARVPLCQDIGQFDANSFSTGSIVVTSNAARVGGLDFTGSTNTPTLAMSNSTEIYGSLKLISGMTLSGSSALNFEGGAGTSNITTAGKSIPWPLTFGSNRTIAPLDAITSTNTLTVFDFSTFNTNGFNHQFSTITLSGGTTNVNDSLTGTGAITVNSSIQPAVLNVNAHFNGASFSESLGTVNLSSQINSTAGITLSGGTTNDSGTSGEYKGTTFSCTGGTHTARKLTLSSTFSRSSTCDLTFPIGGNGTYATSWTDTGTSGSFTANGKMVRSAGAYTVTGSGSYTYGD